MSDTDFLLVDDDSAFSQTMLRALTRKGHTANCCHNAKECLAMLTEKRYRYLLLDLKLGDDSGLQLIEPILEINPDILIVVLTGYSSIATAVQAIKLGAHNYLCKPTGSNDILNAFLGTEPQTTPLDHSHPTSVDRLQWEQIQRVLQDNGGNISATARLLGMHRRTLQRRLAKHPVKQ
ncbi:Fis family two component transcriptional regulator [Sinobacterium caligoides]|uniref:Fis family two component transcriptional regulator n=1 Tax=Sinobacterium caligoides TaxID=933926 RepID=A0A3N2DZW6_9GAMM|nr:response regulator [Sinobacterium caligoides]ROS05192.1 Fis family two component transcriptional regulator [Sinobacterium caligoides]